jgi:hypothetical protein
VSAREIVAVASPLLVQLGGIARYRATAVEAWLVEQERAGGDRT